MDDGKKIDESDDDYYSAFDIDEVERRRRESEEKRRRADSKASEEKEKQKKVQEEKKKEEEKAKEKQARFQEHAEQEKKMERDLLKLEDPKEVKLREDAHLREEMLMRQERDRKVAMEEKAAKAKELEEQRVREEMIRKQEEEKKVKTAFLDVDDPRDKHLEEDHKQIINVQHTVQPSTKPSEVKQDTNLLGVENVEERRLREDAGLREQMLKRQEAERKQAAEERKRIEDMEKGKATNLLGVDNAEERRLREDAGLKEQMIRRQEADRKQAAEEEKKRIEYMEKEKAQREAEAREEEEAVFKKDPKDEGLKEDHQQMFYIQHTRQPETQTSEVKQDTNLLGVENAGERRLREDAGLREQMLSRQEAERKEAADREKKRLEDIEKEKAQKDASDLRQDTNLLGFENREARQLQEDVGLREQMLRRQEAERKEAAEREKQRIEDAKKEETLRVEAERKEEEDKKKEAQAFLGAFLGVPDTREAREERLRQEASKEAELREHMLRREEVDKEEYLKDEAGREERLRERQMRLKAKEEARLQEERRLKEEEEAAKKQFLETLENEDLRQIYIAHDTEKKEKAEKERRLREQTLGREGETNETFQKLQETVAQEEAENREQKRQIHEMRKSLNKDLETIRRQTLKLEEEKKALLAEQRKIDWKKEIMDPNNPRKYEQLGFFDKPRKKTCKQRICDRQDNTFFNRNWREWCRLCIFYICFLTFVTVLFTICMQIFLKTVVRPESPYDSRWVMNQPGLTLFPSDAYGLCLGSRLNKTEMAKVDYAMASRTGSTQFMEWDRQRESFIKRIKFMFKKYLEPYKKYPNLIDLGNCSEENAYGFLENSPCFLLRINRIYNFRFKDYEHFSEFSGDFPLKLRNQIVNTMGISDLISKAFIDCEPVSKSRDILGGIAYWPSSQMVDLSKYDYTSKTVISDSNLMPVITIRLLKPRIWTKLGVNCKIWAKNIIINDEEADHYRGSRKLFFNIKDSEDTTNKGDQDHWDYNSF